MARVSVRQGRLIACVLAFLAVALLVVAPVAAQSTPEKHEEVVYNGEIFDSQGYFGQLYPQAEETIYVIADVSNVLIPKRTLVYWWPISQEYKADWETLDETLSGTLEIGDMVFESTQYSLQYAGGYDSVRTSLLAGEEALEGHAAYQEAIREYNAAASQYVRDRTEWETQLVEWGREVDAARAAGKPTDTIPVPRQPTPPTQPTTIVTTPAPGIAFTLPAGEYALRLRDENGEIVPGSERTIIAIAPRREGLAYNVIAASKYTIPDTSTDPNDTIFVSGEQALYVQPAYEKEYDNYAAAKLLNVQDRTAQNRSGVWTWLPSGEFGGDQLEVSVNGAEPQTVEKQTFHVKQLPGAALGYEILPYDASVVGQVNTFDAFKISPESGVIKIAAPEQPGSGREIRVVQTDSGGLLFALAFLPFAAGIARLAHRRWRTR